jgi:hypothetical protein
VITRPLRRLMALQGLAGVGLGLCAAAGLSITGTAATGVDLVLLAPTAAIQIRPAIKHASLSLAWFLPLMVFAAALALITWVIWSTIGVALGEIGWFSVTEPAVRNQVVTCVALATTAVAAAKALWKTIR